MPGGRLTQQERQQITLGLADGLAYAEIARRLDRPTSTVTREIMRNGGPTAYRADLAQHATERRARGRRQAAPGHPDTPPQAHGRDAEAVREYEETFATVLMHIGHAQDDGTGDGLPHTHRHRQPDRRRTRRTSAGQPGIRLESDRVSRKSGPRAPRTRRTTPRALRRGRRRLVPVDDGQRPIHRPPRRIARQGVGILGPGTPAAARLENIARFVDFVSESIARAARTRPATSSTQNPNHLGQHYLSHVQIAGIGLGDR